jgi:carboxypeptidase C (cathepsin A)
MLKRNLFLISAAILLHLEPIATKHSHSIKVQASLTC